MLIQLHGYMRFRCRLFIVVSVARGPDARVERDQVRKDKDCEDDEGGRNEVLPPPATGTDRSDKSTRGSEDGRRQGLFAGRGWRLILPGTKVGVRQVGNADMAVFRRVSGKVCDRRSWSRAADGFEVDRRLLWRLAPDRFDERVSATRRVTAPVYVELRDREATRARHIGRLVRVRPARVDGRPHDFDCVVPLESGFGEADDRRRRRVSARPLEGDLGVDRGDGWLKGGAFCRRAALLWCRWLDHHRDAILVASRNWTRVDRASLAKRSAEADFGEGNRVEDLGRGCRTRSPDSRRARGSERYDSRRGALGVGRDSGAAVRFGSGGTLTRRFLGGPAPARGLRQAVRVGRDLAKGGSVQFRGRRVGQAERARRRTTRRHLVQSDQRRAGQVRGTSKEESTESSNEQRPERQTTTAPEDTGQRRSENKVARLPKLRTQQQVAYSKRLPGPSDSDVGEPVQQSCKRVLRSREQRGPSKFGVNAAVAQPPPVHAQSCPDLSERS